MQRYAMATAVVFPSTQKQGRIEARSYLQIVDLDYAGRMFLSSIPRDGYGSSFYNEPCTLRLACVESLKWGPGFCTPEHRTMAV
jgi:hypothetical protein